MNMTTVDCATGAVETRPLTSEELAAAQQIADIDHATAMRQKAETARDHALIRQAAQPGTTITSSHFAAIARLLGVQ